MKLQLKKTADNSHTLYATELDEWYHSQHGAVQESRHVFIRNGLLMAQRQHTFPLQVLEVGLGTGLNALLTYQQSLVSGFPVYYTGLEPYPLTPDLYKALNYPKHLDLHDARKRLTQLHQAPAGKVQQLSPAFHFTLHHKKLEDFEPADAHYHLVYFDAFAPSRQPDIWRKANLQKLYACLVNGGILVTYCAQGRFRRALAATGFEVGALAGPPGKRAMTRAVK